MYNTNLELFLDKARIPQNPGMLAGGLVEKGKFVVALHTERLRPSLAILAAVINQGSAENFKSIDFKGSLTKSYLDNDLDLSHDTYAVERYPSASEGLDWAISWAQTIADREAGDQDILMLAGIDGLGSLPSLSENRDFVDVMADCTASGCGIIATAEVKRGDLPAQIEAARRFADRVFWVDQVWPSSVGTTRMRFRNLSDRHQLDRATFTYRGNTMSQKLGSMLV